jgi:hypothetical protein
MNVQKKVAGNGCLSWTTYIPTCQRVAVARKGAREEKNGW